MLHSEIHIRQQNVDPFVDEEQDSIEFLLHQQREVGLVSGGFDQINGRETED